jgi:hypothetical protein
MSELWPHLPSVVSALMFDELKDLVAGGDLASRSNHPEQTWAPVGGRVPERRIRELADAVTTVAASHGFPQAAGSEARIAFDRDAARVVRTHLDLSWAEAGNRDLWSFLAFVVLPNVTMWRFGLKNRERWIATDLTRQTWARLWWHAVVFEGDEDLLADLTESDLNHLLERRSIGGDPRLVRELARAVIELSAAMTRRPVIRDVTLRLRRYLAFVDVRALSDSQIQEFCSSLTAETVTRLRDRVAESS